MLDDTVCDWRARTLEDAGGEGDAAVTAPLQVYPSYPVASDRPLKRPDCVSGRRPSSRSASKVDGPTEGRCDDGPEARSDSSGIRPVRTCRSARSIYGEGGHRCSRRTDAPNPDSRFDVSARRSLSQ
jgi:hypothetical protein